MTSYMRLQMGSGWRRAVVMTTLAVTAVACTPNDVLQVTVLPWSHALQAATHWVMSRGLKEV